MSIPDTKNLRGLLAGVLLSVPYDNLPVATDLSDELNTAINPIGLILEGQSSKLVIAPEYSELLFGGKCKQILSEYPANSLKSVLVSYIEEVVINFNEKFGIGEVAKLHLHLVAIALLQLFIQINYTGPSVEFTSSEMFFGVESEAIQADSVRLLSVSGQRAYELASEPLFLIISELLFETLSGISSKYSLIGEDGLPIEDIVYSVEAKSQVSDDPISASIQWWRSRALQVQLSILSEPASVLASLSSVLLNPSVVNNLAPSSDQNEEVQRNIQLIYFLESARSNLHSQTEHLAIPLLGKARKTSNFNLILTGAKAKRTKFQDFTRSGLIILAVSDKTNGITTDKGESGPESFDLNSDVLLERPHYESLDDIEYPEDGVKRIKFDNSYDADEEEKLLPIALRQELIPDILKSLDPNNPPALNDLDNLQLLLRLTAVRQTTPSNDPLVEEELVALVQRVLFSPSGSINWSIFSRALWERSILETNKAKTIERGILQMQSLVEELGTKIKTRIIPRANSNVKDEASETAARLRFIHQLTLLPQWAMDSRLAEKYMSIGVFRSAIQIYERLGMVPEAALCYATVGDEKAAEELLLERLAKVPDDARSISILGDVRQDPTLWTKAWEVGRYVKAKNSLAQYYYKPPAGVQKDINLAIDHLHDSLTINPLSYDGWFFYGCLGLEVEQYEMAAEAFSRCVALDDTNAHSWSNLASALLKTNKKREAFNALKKAIRSASESKKSWRIYENYLIVASQLNEWNDVLIAARELINIKQGTSGEGSIDIPVIEKLVEILVATNYPKESVDSRLTHYQSSCIDFVCNLLPSVITTSARAWRIVARVELWRQRPWTSLEAHEKAYRALSHNPDLETNQEIWDETVEACSDLVAAYESLGELPGKHGAGDLVCKDWKYQSRTTIRSLMSKGKMMWEDSEGWNKLQELKEELQNN